MPEVITFGCRLNTFESEIIRRHAAEAGVGDVVVFNTCAVTTEAVRQAGQAIRKVKRERPEALVIVTGCAAQIAPDKFLSMTEVDCVVGNRKKLDATVFAQIKEKDHGRYISDEAGEGLLPDFVERFEGLERAFVQIQNGCDNACTFCIVPLARGASRSVPLERVAEQIRLLVARGYNEIVLTGVDIAAYGKELERAPDLGKLIKFLLHEIPELPRLRLSSLDGAEISESFWDVIAEPRLMPYFHLSLQSGDDLILKRMRRRHSREQAIAFCRKIKQLRPDAVLGADFIVGFPTEEEAHFQQTCQLVDEADLTWLHVFSYSARPGTPAALMPQVHGEIRKERAQRLKEIADKKATAHLAGLVGTRQFVLVEQAGLGCAPGFAKIDIPAEAPVGAVVEVLCVSFEEGRVTARLV